MSDCPKCGAPFQPIGSGLQVCAACNTAAPNPRDQFADMNFYMLLDGYDHLCNTVQEICDDLYQEDRVNVGPGRQYALIKLKLAAEAAIREFREEMATRAEKP
jgi:hypothetical protein